VEVKLFDQLIPISSGPVWLAQTYQRPIVPIYVFKQKKRIFIKVLKPITNLTGPTQEISQQVAASLEQMIDVTLSDWQVTDRFLLPQLR
jgi:lauroyl/myristoyl acyltransferase